MREDFIAIGGTRHGQLLTTEYGRTVVWRNQMLFSRPFFDDVDPGLTVQVDEYEVRSYYLSRKGEGHPIGRRKLFYLVLKTLTEEEAVKLIEQVEAEEEEINVRR